VRERGYSVERLAEESTRVMEVIGSLRNSPAADAVRHRLSDVLSELVTPDYLPDEIGTDNVVVTVAAPVFDDIGSVTASVVACPDARMTAYRLSTVGEAVVAAANSIAKRFL
jgi:DNA-binding IclR family transcriptional regulator